MRLLVGISYHMREGIFENISVIFHLKVIKVILTFHIKIGVGNLSVTLMSLNSNNTAYKVHLRNPIFEHLLFGVFFPSE